MIFVKQVFNDLTGDPFHWLPFVKRFLDAILPAGGRCCGGRPGKSHEGVLPELSRPPLWFGGD